MSRNDDTARREFLQTLVVALGDKWVVGYSEAKTFGVIAATLRREGVDGYVQVVPSVVRNNAITWKPFPGSGRPHFDIKIDGTGHQRTCILEQAVGILERWAKSKQPLERGAIEPMLPAVRPVLEAIAAAPLAHVEDAVVTTGWSLTAAGKKQLAAARKRLDTEAIARAFPRDDDGRLVATRALLAPVQTTKPMAAGREVFLAVQGPRTKREGERLQLVLVDAIEANETHRWMDARWLWRSDATRPADDKRAAACLALLDAGAFDKALAMYGIELSAPAIRMLEGVPTGGHSSHELEWRATMRRVLWSMAVWKLRALPHARLALLPRQLGQVKGWISWTPPSTIDIGSTASNARVARCRWAREVDFDLARLGIVRNTKGAAVPKAAKATPQKPLAEMIAGKALWKAATALKHAKLRPPREAFAELLAIVDGNGKPDARANALWIAVEIGSASDGKVLAKYLHDHSDRVRHMAIDAVKRFRYTQAVPALAGMICESPTSMQAGYAVTALKSLSGTQGLSGLVPYFASRDPRVREAACRAFAVLRQGREFARPYLEKMLTDDNAAVVAAAKSTIRALAKG